MANCNANVLNNRILYLEMNPNTMSAAIIPSLLQRRSQRWSLQHPPTSDSSSISPENSQHPRSLLVNNQIPSGPSIDFESTVQLRSIIRAQVYSHHLQARLRQHQRQHHNHLRQQLLSERERYYNHQLPQQQLNGESPLPPDSSTGTPASCFGKVSHILPNLAASLGPRNRRGRRHSRFFTSNSSTDANVPNRAGAMSALSNSGTGNNNDPNDAFKKDRLFDVHVLPERMPHRLCYLYDQPFVSEFEAMRYAWNPNDRSTNLFVKPDDPFTFHRHPVAQSTDSARGKGGFSSGLHIWEIRWPRPERGTNAVVGVATEKFQLHCEGYRSLVGNCANSWGWDLGRMRLLHNLPWSAEPDYSQCPRYPALNCPLTEYSGKHCPHSVSIPDVFHVVLNMDAGTLGFVVNGLYLGEAFSGLQGKTVYPVVSCVWGHCEISLKYLNCLHNEPQSLQDLVRHTIRGELSSQSDQFPYEPMEEDVNQLPLPKSLRQWLK